MTGSTLTTHPNGLLVTYANGKGAIVRLPLNEVSTRTVRQYPSGGYQQEVTVTFTVDHAEMSSEPLGPDGLEHTR